MKTSRKSVGSTPKKEYKKPTVKVSSGDSLLQEELKQFEGSEGESVKGEGTGIVIQKEELSNQISETPSGFSEEEFRNEKTDVELGKLKTGRIVMACFVGLIVSVILVAICYGCYRNYIMYPDEAEIVYENTGLYCLENWESNVHGVKGIGEGSYIKQETTYANGNEYKIAFYRKMLSTVKYESLTTVALDVYGNPLKDRDGKLVYTPSTVGEGEEVIMSCIDYSRVVLDKETIQNMMKDVGLSIDNINYSTELVNVFCRYMSSLDTDSLPIRQIKRVPNMVKLSGAYTITEEEDIYIDNLLFASEDLYTLMDRFSFVAGGESITESEEWLSWNALSEEQKAEVTEPDKYSSKQMMEKYWCGVYYLQNEYSIVDSDGKVIRQPISAEIGDGTFENPAGLNTDVITCVIEEDADGNEVSYPIKIRMVEYGVSEDAIKWLEDQSVKNRGIDVTSELQYVYYVFQITNLSDKILTITDNSILCDKNANISSRTGTMYGLQDSIKLLPDETGVLETWNSSTGLNKKYVIWGKDFARRAEPVWFRVLAGNIDDPSENKGVTINNSREN